MADGSRALAFGYTCYKAGLPALSLSQHHPALRTLLPTWARANRGGASRPGQDPGLSGQTHIAPCWTQSQEADSH